MIRTKSGLLVQFAPSSLNWLLANIQSSLGQLPSSGNVSSFESEKIPVLAPHNEYDTGSKDLGSHIKL
jgi:hypothetical protein